MSPRHKPRGQSNNRAQERKNLAERGENAARIKRLEAHAQQASAYAAQMAAAQQQRAAAEAARRKAAEEAARKAAEQAAIRERSQQFATQREERKQKNATNHWDTAQSIVQSSFGNSFGGGQDASKQSQYNVMGKNYDFSSNAASESAPNGNVEATGDNKPPDSQTFANNYKSKVLEDQKNKQANNPNNYNA